MVVAGSVGLLLVVVPAAVLVGLVATGNATDVGGLMVLGMCLAGGGYVLFDVLTTSGGSSALQDFAAANDLVLLGSDVVPHYGGSLFADESHALHQSVRTHGDRFVEVGERFPTTAPDRSRKVNRPQLFLRSRLAGRAAGDPREIVTPALHERLVRLAGEYALEVSDDELTVFGSDGLDVQRPGRVQEAFSLVDELTARADAELVPTAPEQPSSGFTVPMTKRPEPRRGRHRSPLAIAGLTLALVGGGALAIAVVMSILDDQLEGDRGTARLVVGLVVAAALVVVGWFVKAMMTRRADRDRKPEQPPTGPA